MSQIVEFDFIRCQNMKNICTEMLTKAYFHKRGFDERTIILDFHRTKSHTSGNCYSSGFDSFVLLYYFQFVWLFFLVKFFDIMKSILYCQFRRYSKFVRYSIHLNVSIKSKWSGSQIRNWIFDGKKITTRAVLTVRDKEG